MDQQQIAEKGLCLDLGCGASKKEGTIGVDIVAFPGVDCVVDMESQPLPFADRSVEYIFSSHFLEHTVELGNIFVEIGRVCKDGAQLEIWTPYGWHNDALLPGHRTFLTEEHYLHICVVFPDVWQAALRSRWVLNEVQYVISEDVLALLAAQKISVGFAVKHMINIVKEFCVHITVLHHTPQETSAQFKQTYSTSRKAPRQEVTMEVNLPSTASDTVPAEELQPAQLHSRGLRRLIPRPLKRLIKSIIYPD